MSLILASGSPRRKELLAMICPEFSVITSEVDESAITAPTPAETALALATAKCKAVAKEHPEDVVIGCDTVVDCGGRIFGKPADRNAAVAMLRELSGKGHQVHTGVCVCKGDVCKSLVATSTVRFYPIEEAAIQAYVDTPEPYDKAGGYAIQGTAALFCEGIDGCYYNIMGMPVSRLARLLREFGI